jgi:hypothetical protein
MQSAAPAKGGVDPIRAIREIIRKHKRWDLIFAGLGMLALTIGVVTLAGLFIDLVATGWSRLTPDFFTSFSSRRASGDGGGAPRRRRRHLSGRVRAEELAHQRDRD